MEDKGVASLTIAKSCEDRRCTEFTVLQLVALLKLDDSVNRRETNWPELFSTQWLAVSTMLEAIRVPVHIKLGPFMRPTLGASVEGMGIPFRTSGGGAVVAAGSFSFLLHAEIKAKPPRLRIMNFRKKGNLRTTTPLLQGNAGRGKCTNSAR